MYWAGDDKWIKQKEERHQSGQRTEAEGMEPLKTPRSSWNMLNH